jgi:uncharacterized membrane protein
MSTIEESIDVEVPVSTAYGQWTQFESFPRFMAAIERVEQVDDTHLHWVADIGGSRREWDAEITEQHPDERIGWRALDQEGPDGVVTFHKLSDGKTRVMVQMEYEPHGLKETAGAMAAPTRARCATISKSFKEFIEQRGASTGRWAGMSRHLRSEARRRAEAAAACG